MKQICKFKFHLLVFILFNFINFQANNKNICIVSPLGTIDNNSLIFNSSYDIRDEVHKPFYMLANKLRSLNYNISFVNKTDNCHDANYILFFGPDISLINKFRYLNAKKIYFSFEPPIINPYYLDKNYQNIFHRLFLLLDDLADNNKTFKFFYPQPDLKKPASYIPFKQKKFCTFIASYRVSSVSNDLYNERIKIINFFEKNYPSDFDFYGVNWPSNYKCYKGPIKHKKNYLQYYKFCICYENSRYNGYITEKIFDAMVSGCIPIYLGANNISKYIPDNCFIDRTKFKSEQELYNYLKNMDETTYNKYLENINIFLKSALAQKFSVDNFINTIIWALNN